MGRRLLLRSSLALGALVLIATGVLWARPDLLASISEALHVPLPPALDPAVNRPTTGSEASAEGSSNLQEPPTEWVDDGWCATHNAPESNCAACKDQKVPPGQDRPCLEKLPLIRFKSPDVARRIGLATTPVVQRTHADTLLGNAEIVYDANSYAEVRPRVPGFIREVLVDEGLVVKKGDPLIVVDSAEVGSAKAAYLGALPVVELAQATLARTRSLTQANALPLKDELEAQTASNRAKADMLNAAQRLHNLGFTEADLADVAKRQDTSSLLRILSPIDGTIVQRHAVSGEAIEASSQIFVVADVRQMWAWIDVYENEIERVRAGQTVRFWIGGTDSGAPHEGVVDWIDAAVNPATRTIRVRAVLKNPDARLRSNQFGRAEILVGREHQALFVPRDAVQLVGDHALVFLAQPDGSYRPQRVVVEKGENLLDEEEIEWGLQAGQNVVTTGSFLLKSELMRDELAGD